MSTQHNFFDRSPLDIEFLRGDLIQTGILRESTTIVPKNQSASAREASHPYTFPCTVYNQLVPEINDFRSDPTKLPPVPEAFSRKIRIAIDIATNINIANNTKLPPIGDTTCRNNANSPHLRCAVNPDPEAGTCERCPDYESALE